MPTPTYQQANPFAPGVVSGAGDPLAPLKRLVPPGYFSPEQAATTQGAAIVGRPTPPITNVEVPEYGPSVARFSTGTEGSIQAGMTPSTPLSPRLAGGNLAAGAYQTDPGSIDPLSLTANQMGIDQRLRESFAARELDPLQQAAKRSQLELTAEDPLAKERLIGQMDIQRAAAPAAAMRQYDLEDQRLLQQLGPALKLKLEQDRDYMALPPDKRAEYFQRALDQQLEMFKTARGKFNFREGGLGF